MLGLYATTVAIVFVALPTGAFAQAHDTKTSETRQTPLVLQPAEGASYATAASGGAFHACRSIRHQGG
jgi:hypothetical protein